MLRDQLLTSHTAPSLPPHERSACPSLPPGLRAARRTATAATAALRLLHPLRQRSLRLWFLCYNDQGNVPREETVLESSMCVYDIFVYSAYGCPLECPLVQGADGTKRLCSGHGVCDYDQGESLAARQADR